MLAVIWLDCLIAALLLGLFTFLTWLYWKAKATQYEKELAEANEHLKNTKSQYSYLLTQSNKLETDLNDNALMLKDARNSLILRDQSIADLQNQIEVHEAKIKIIEPYRIKFDDLSKQYGDAQTLITNLQAGSSKLELDNSNLAKELAACRENSKNLQASIDTLTRIKTEYETLLPKYKTLEDELAALKAKLKTADDSIVGLRSNLSLLEGIKTQYDLLLPQSEQYKNDLGISNQKIIALQTDNGNAQRTIDDLKQQLAQLNSDYDKAKNQHLALTTEYNNFKNQYNQLTAEIQTLKNNNLQLIDNNGSLKLRISMLEEEARAAAAELQRKQDEVNALEKMLDDCEGKKDSLQQHIAAAVLLTNSADLEKGLLKEEINALRIILDDTDLEKGLAREHGNALALLLEDMQRERDRLAAEIAALRLQREAISTEMSEKEKALANIKSRASTINFDRIGRASHSEKDDLLIIKGVGPFIEEKLHALGIYTFEQVANFTPEDEDTVNTAIEFFPGRIRRENWREQSANFVRIKKQRHRINFNRIGKGNVNKKDDLNAIKGITTDIEAQLYVLGIYNYSQITALTPEDINTVEEILGLSIDYGYLHKWSEQAVALSSVRQKADTINFDRIGRANASEKDDLQEIKGIGPFIEQKLNAIGIYTFRQIASFTEEDEEVVNDAIEFFPGRINREEWRRQARELDKQKKK